MELRQLRYFVRAAELLSFSEAARSLNVAQSTLSQQVKQLEEELGATLFEREGHSVSLTEAGSELLPFARNTLIDADTCRHRLDDLGRMLTGTLNIGVTYSFSPILTETLLTFMKQYPGVKLNIFYKPMAELMEMLRNRAIDFALAFRPPAGIDDIESHVLFDNHLAAIVREGHSLASRDRISLSDLERHDIALPSRGLQARNALEYRIERYRPRLNVRLELNEVNILLRLIKHSDLVTVLAEATTYNETGVKAIPLDLPDNEIDGCVHMLRNTYRKRSALEFIRMLKDSNAVRARLRSWFG